MKTGRVRRKAQPSPEETPPPSQPPIEPAEGLPPQPPEEPPVEPPSEPSIQEPEGPRATGAVAGTTTGKPAPIGCILGLILGLIAVLVIFLLLSSRGSRQEWVEATRAAGSWTTTSTVFGPQVAVEQRWESDCLSNPMAAVQPGSCVLRDTDTFRDTVVDDYDEYAYNVYYEETWNQVYQAQGADFVLAQLGRDDWWEGNLHYILEEELDRDSCTYTEYTVWVDDPDDRTQEMEVYLAECEVWDHVVVSEREYEQRPWCLCDVTRFIQIGTQQERGAGSGILWPSPSLPAGGRMEEAFQGQVTFTGQDYSYTVTTSNQDEYERYLTGQYYIGIVDGQPVDISASPPK